MHITDYYAKQNMYHLFKRIINIAYFHIFVQNFNPVNIFVNIVMLTILRNLFYFTKNLLILIDFFSSIVLKKNSEQVTTNENKVGMFQKSLYNSWYMKWSS
jgi:hypothetical protein